jgi:hypothetical protein
LIGPTREGGRHIGIGGGRADAERRLRRQRDLRQRSRLAAAGRPEHPSVIGDQELWPTAHCGQHRGLLHPHGDRKGVRKCPVDAHLPHVRDRCDRPLDCRGVHLQQAVTGHRCGRIAAHLGRHRLPGTLHRHLADGEHRRRLEYLVARDADDQPDDRQQHHQPPAAARLGNCAATHKQGAIDRRGKFHAPNFDRRRFDPA